MVRDVRRFNYLEPARWSPAGIRLPVIAIDNRVRGPLSALGATLVVSISLGLVQAGRLHAAQIAYAAAAVRLSDNAAALHDVELRRAQLLREARLWDTIVGERRAGLRHADDLAWIGNRLPPQTWLRALRYEDGRYTLEGASAQAEAVGSAMLALRDTVRATVPQLVSLRTDGDGTAARVQYRLTIADQP